MMKKIVILLGLLLTCGIAIANDNSSTENSDKYYFIRTDYVTPCNSWNYTSNGYTCRSTGLSLQIPDGYDVKNAVADIDNRIIDLEKRVKALESQNQLLTEMCTKQ